MPRKRFTLPFVLPVAAFAGAIFIGAVLLWREECAAGDPVSFVDALFIATSAVCVTGLASVDPSAVFNRLGHTVMMVLIQLGGLGITTYSTLIFYFWSRRISLTDRLAVGEALLNDPSFHLGHFLQRIIAVILTLECIGGVSLYLMEPERIGVFNAAFLAVSAFCNAGFALWPDNLVSWRDHVGVNCVIMSLIILGGLGFAVIDECLRLVKARLDGSWKMPLNPANATARARAGIGPREAPKLSYPAKIVLGTTAFLIFSGAAALLATGYFSGGHTLSELVWPSLFQSVTARTAGFNTVPIGQMTDAALLVLILLMYIGGSPGSCAGGIKTTAFRTLVGFVAAQLRGRSQITVGGKAVDAGTMNKVFVLLIFSTLTILGSTFALTYTEGGTAIHGRAPFQVLDLFFETVSAFATVGLSTGITTELTAAGKLIDCALMFIGRLGPIWLITTLQQLQTEPRYRLPETDMPVG